ncbi:site-specific integrase [Anaeromicropila populeti]|uniref:Phage integrase family protein n=1 Tax=Anaeromicropila populeti TaxID=37658 RepID=A0A1I6LX08_9FIRM|nr:site-specific integrase [Anaeromicropila populeti]SFS08009.1 Phage integrase family protein [Anaeromicropila populeti]
MKFDILEDYKQYVQEHTKSPQTAKKYYSAVKNLFADIQFNHLQEIEQEYLKGKLSTLKTKNEFSAAKNGLKLLHQFDSTLKLPDEAFFKENSLHKKNHRKKAEPIYTDETMRKVNQIQNKKLKLAYRLAVISGLRVFELEALTPEDFDFQEDGTISVNVRNGKGGKNGIVYCRKDNYVFQELKKYIQENGKADTRLFYSEEYMREKANDLGLECHDFRRIYAFLHRKELKESGMNTYDANKIVQENMRHSRFKTTRRYLYGKKFYEKRSDKE